MDDSFTYADSFDESAKRYRGLRCGQPITLFGDKLSGLLVKSDIAVNQQYAEKRQAPETMNVLPSTETGKPYNPAGSSVPLVTETGTGEVTIIVPPKEQLLKRFHGSVVLDAARVGRDGHIADEVISHLVGLLGSKVIVTLEIEAEVPSGVPDNVVRVVTENSRTLKFSNHGFEKE